MTRVQWSSRVAERLALSAPRIGVEFLLCFLVIGASREDTPAACPLVI